MFILRCRQAYLFATGSSPVSLTPPAISYRRYRCYRQLIIADVVDTNDKFFAGVMESMKIQDNAQ
jgi:hypothetical protein